MRRRPPVRIVQKRQRREPIEADVGRGACDIGQPLLIGWPLAEHLRVGRPAVGTGQRHQRPARRLEATGLTGLIAPPAVRVAGREDSRPQLFLQVALCHGAQMYHRVHARRAWLVATIASRSMISRTATFY